MKIFVSSGEASSDIHGAELVAHLKKKSQFEFYGLGGDRLEAQGCHLLVHNRVFSVGGGPKEIIGKLPARYKLERLVEKSITESKDPPVGAILIDNGEINLRLAALFHFFKIPVVYYIPPKVWVWRHQRIEKIAQHVSMVLGILPFEEEIYRSWEIPFHYVGNPLLDEVNQQLTVEQAKKNIGVALDREVISILCGSRHNEVASHIEPFAKALLFFAEKFKKEWPQKKLPLLVLPCAQAIEPGFLKEQFSNQLQGSGFEVVVTTQKSHDSLKAATVALVKSGTSTLEAGLLGVPMVMAYQVSSFSRWIFKNIVRYHGFVGLINLFLAKSSAPWENQDGAVVEELLLEKCIPEKIGEELFKLYSDQGYRKKMTDEFLRLSALLSNPQKTSPSDFASEKIIELFSNPNRKS